MKLPVHSKAVDWEIELVAVIGKLAKDVPVENALDYVAGYTIGNDLSARDLLTRTKTPAPSPFKSDWIGAKNFDGACPIGPWITPAKRDS
ncbi:fumarylacetoacetate hydrolase family protein [Polaromonas sp. P1(28)-8]|nr:fumarylacetoacetate hydrolase family protein [Polaromonas sp. P1(28)-8]